MFREKIFPGIRIALFVLLVAIPCWALMAQDTPTAEEPTLVATDPAPEPTAVVTLEPTEEPPPVEPPPEETPVTSPEELLGQLFSLLKDATFIVWASAGVVVIVGLLKSVFKFADTAAVLVTLLVQVLIWLGYAIANYFGAGEAFQKGYLILVDLARSLLPLAGIIFGSKVLYDQSVRRDTPIMGYRAPHKNS